MPLKQIFPDPDEAVADIFDGAVVMLGGFAGPGTPERLVQALLRRGTGSLTLICNESYGKNPERYDAARLIEHGQVRKVITSLPVSTGLDSATERLWRQGKLEVEAVPQGTLTERIRAAGAGLGGFWVKVGLGTPFQQGKERRFIDGEEYLYEPPLRADFALLRAWKADTLGNLVYRRTQRNHNPLMAMAARVSVVEVDELVEPGGLDPERVITPGIYVNRIVVLGRG